MRRLPSQLKLNLILPAVLGVVYLVPLVCQAVLGGYTRYMADDFCVAAVARVMGLIEAERYWYVSWSGRFSYLALVDLASLIGPSLTPVLPAVLIVLWSAAVYWSLRQIEARWRPSRLVAAVLALTVVAATLNAIPNVAQSLDWRNSGLTYTAPLIAGSLLAGLILRFGAAPGASTRWRLAGGLLVFGLAFVAGGFSEVFTALQVVLCGLGLAAAVLLAMRGGSWLAGLPWLAGLLGSGAALAGIALAPGTHARQASFAAPPGLRAVLGNANQYSRWFVRDAFGQQTPVILGVVAAGALLALIAWASSTERRVPQGRWLAAGLLGLPVITFGLLVVCYAPVFYAIQYLPPDRVLIIMWYVLIVASAAWGSLAGLAMASAWRAANVHAPRPALLASAIVLAGVAAVPPLAGAARTLSALPAAQSYASTWDSYDQMLVAARANGAGANGAGDNGGSTVTLARLTSPGNIDNLSSDPLFWTNNCLTQYYGVRVQALAPPPIPDPAELAQRTPLQARIGDAAQVLGYQLDQTAVRAGDMLSVTVYWEPLADTDRPYTVFIHLLSSAAGSLGQADGYPGQGQYPTTLWIHGQVFADHYELPVRMDAPAGEAMLILGLYDLPTGQRLPVSGADAGPAGQDWVQFGQIQVAR